MNLFLCLEFVTRNYVVSCCVESCRIRVEIWKWNWKNMVSIIFCLDVFKLEKIYVSSRMITCFLGPKNYNRVCRNASCFRWIVFVFYKNNTTSYNIMFTSCYSLSCRVRPKHNPKIHIATFNSRLHTHTYTTRVHIYIYKLMRGF